MQLTDKLLKKPSVKLKVLSSLPENIQKKLMDGSSAEITLPSGQTIMISLPSNKPFIQVKLSEIEMIIVE